MKKSICLLLSFCLCALCFFTACNRGTDGTADPGAQENPSGAITEPAADSDAPDEPGIPENLESGVNTLTVTCVEGTQECWAFDGNRLLFSGNTAETVCSLSGEFDGRIVISAAEEYPFELELNGVTLFCGTGSPVEILSGEKVTLTAKKGSQNFIYDTRAAVAAEDETAHAAAVYAETDLCLGGKGELTVVSDHNNGIHTKDDLSVKNLTLSVSCEDNALKGNDSVEITGGVLTLIARSGDGIKTTNTDISKKGKQRGPVTVTGGTVRIYAACDGIDAAYDVEISDEAFVDIHTDSYSPYAASAGQNTGGYTLNSAGTQNNTAAFLAFGGRGNGSGRPGDRGGPGGGDVFGPGGGDVFGPGGGGGNSAKGTNSAKGIKAGNEIHIYGGTLALEARDDALHANNSALENGASSTGNVVISGGMLTLLSKDDGIHADGTLTVTGGSVEITGCYEGLEGTAVNILGGNISVISSDDGINATATSGTGITFAGGTVYIYAGGDGIDANSRTSYKGIVFAGGNITVVSTTSMNSSIDTEQGYTYTGGTVLALCPANGMGGESTKCQNFNSVGKKTTMNLKAGQVLEVRVGGELTASITMPCQLSALVIYLGSPSAEFSAK